MMTAFIFEIDVLELRKQKPTSVEQSKVILCKNSLQYLVEFYADEKQEDESMPIKEGVYNYYDIRLCKNKIDGMQQEFDNDLELWCIAIFVNGKNPISIWSETKEKSDQILSTLDKWLWEDDTK